MVKVHKLRHNSANTVNLLCSRSLENESAEHCFLCRNIYATFRTTLINDFNSIKSKFNTSKADEFVRTIFDNESNFKKLIVTTNFVKTFYLFIGSIKSVLAI